MRKKKVREQVISIMALFSVFIFFIYLKMNPEVASTSLSSEVVETRESIIEDVVEVETNEEHIDNNKVSTNAEKEELSESIIEYTESELKRAQAYLNRDWKPDHTINLAAWEYVSKIGTVEDKETLKEVFNMDNQVVNVIK